VDALLGEYERTITGMDGTKITIDV